MIRKKWVCRLLLGLLLSFIVWQGSAHAETATIEVRYLPLQEAANLAKSQLSEDGKIALLPSRNLMIIQDKSAKIKQVKTILQQFDVVVAQLSIQVNLIENTDENSDDIQVSEIKLPGGWVKIKANTQQHQSMRQQHFMLRLSSGKSGRIEAGEVRAIRPSVHRLLLNYGIKDTTNIALYPITAGFSVRASLIDDTHARIHIRPWFERQHQKTEMQAKTEILLDLGRTNATKKPPDTSAPIRANITPALPEKTERINLIDAESELIVELDKPVTLAAISGGAANFSQALLSRRALHSQGHIQISIQVNQVK